MSEQRDYIAYIGIRDLGYCRVKGPYSLYRNKGLRVLQGKGTI